MRLKIRVILGILLFPVLANAQGKDINKMTFDFEASSLQPWVVTGNQSVLSKANFHLGKQSLELHSGSTAKVSIAVQPGSVYKITGWLKTESGSDEVRLNAIGSGGQNIGVASALATWKMVELQFTTDTAQKETVIEIQNPENNAGNRAWADDLNVVYLSEYNVIKDKGVKALPLRSPSSDMGIVQQPNDKMEWLLDAKFGMFIHWGLYSGTGKGEWYMQNTGTLPDEYRKLAYKESGEAYFDAADFDAEKWAGLADDAGMKYMCMVTMHHDGYGLFDSKAINAFNTKQTHNRDFVKEYVDACRKHSLRVGLYKTLINWRYPGYYDVTGNDCKPNKFGYTTNPDHKENAALMKNELYCQVKELMTNYGKIDIIFWDGGWLAQQGGDADAATFWESGKYLDPANAWPVNNYFRDTDPETGKSLGLMGMVRKYQPDVLVNSRSGWIGDFKSEEGSQAVTGPIRAGAVWEKCMPMAPAWGYTPAHNDPAKVMSTNEVKRMLADCVVRNISLLLNVAPDRHGNITAAEQESLRGTGKWLSEVGEAVYDTRSGPWNPKDNEYGYTYKRNTIYIYLLEGYQNKEFVLPQLNDNQKVIRAYSVSDGSKVKFKKNGDKETILSGFEKKDPVVTILAVELNRAVREK